jgi:hypothetical protein
VKAFLFLGLCAVLFLFGPPPTFGLNDNQDDYQFDLSEIEKEIEKKPYQLGGFLEIRPVLSGLDDDAAFYRIRLFDQEGKTTRQQYNLGLRLEGSHEKGMASLYFRADSILWHDDQGWDGDIDLSEGYLSLKPNPRFTLNIGKEVVPWGKGYAFNPVAFVSRPKDPDNPTEALEGFYVVTADLIRSFKGPLKTLAFTPVLLPVTKTVNDDFGQLSHLNVAGKLYLLLWDTDLDLIFFTGGSRTTRYGLDFARNITTNFEIHGELAWITDFEKNFIDIQGNRFTEETDVIQALFGIRYLTVNDITFIIEYFHNGGGIDQEDAENFYQFVDRAADFYLSTGDRSLLTQAGQLSQGTLATDKPMRDYLYFRASWKEPFDILYFTPAVTSIVNLTDQSFSLAPEVLYIPETNLEFRLRGTLLTGGNQTEYGEKRSDYKVEFRVRYYF